MSRDHFESIAIIPSPSGNFDEVYTVIDRTNGRMIERMSLRLGGNNCSGEVNINLEDQIFMDSAINFTFGSNNLTQIEIGTNDLFRITSPNHGFSNGDIVTLGNVADYPQLSGRTFVIYGVTTDTFLLGEEIFQ